MWISCPRVDETHVYFTVGVARGAQLLIYFTFIMETYTWLDLLSQSFGIVWANFYAYVPTILFAVLIFIIGWLISVIVGRVICQIIDMLKIDDALRAAGLEDALKRMNVRLNTGMFFATLVRWFILIAFLMASLEMIGLAQITFFLQDVVLDYVPRVIAAALMLVVGAIVADMVRRLVLKSAEAANISAAGFLASIAQWSIWMVALFSALDQLQIAADFIQNLFTGVVVALSLAFGLAFGLGGQKAAAEFIEKVKKDIGEK